MKMFSIQRKIYCEKMNLNLAISSFVSLLVLSTAEECIGKCTVPTLVYDDLKCTPKYTSNDCCPSEYDCSHIYNRESNTCHFKGKFYKPGQQPDREDTTGSCDHATCTCTEEQDFRCIVPSDSCAEFWVPNFVKPGCYLTYEQNRCCSNGQNCEPRENYKTCEVNGVIYKEGQKFERPDDKCTKCVCENNFSGDLNSSCQKLNCTTSALRYSKAIDNYCAPAYRNLDSCCPNSWICPSENGTYKPAPSPPTNPNLKCKFGSKTLSVGEQYVDGTTNCECVVPPYLTCTIK